MQQSLGHNRWLHNQFPPFSSVLHCPLELGDLLAFLFPAVIFPPLLLSPSSSSPFHCALQDDFGQAWWKVDASTPLLFASVYNGQAVFMWSHCLLDLGADFTIGNKHGICTRCIVSCSISFLGSRDSLLVECQICDRRLWVWILLGAAGEFSPPELTFCADSYLVSVPSLCYRSGTKKTQAVLPKV